MRSASAILSSVENIIRVARKPSQRVERDGENVVKRVMESGRTASGRVCKGSN